jgi:hypothetical protein
MAAGACSPVTSSSIARFVIVSSCSIIAFAVNAPAQALNATELAWEVLQFA